MVPALNALTSLSPNELFFQRIAVGRDGRNADIQIFECVKLGFFGLADHESLIYRHIAIDHCW